jgi:ankyrin repeat protein
LSRAAEKGDERVVELLLQNGACPDFEDEDGQTPLARVVETGSIEVVQLLLARGVKVDYKYTIQVVSESNYFWMEFPSLIADTITLDYCRV